MSISGIEIRVHTVKGIIREEFELLRKIRENQRKLGNIFYSLEKFMFS